MARPQSPDYDKRREAIVAAAAGLYARRGFQGASVADLAKACDTSKSLIYHYFPAKDDILHAVMAEHLDALVAAAAAARRDGGPPEEQLRALTLAFMRHYVGARDRHKVLLSELDNLSTAARADVVAKQRRVIATTQAIIAELAPAQDARVTTMLFFGMINWTHTWFDPAGSVMPEMLALRVVDLMLRGVHPS